MTTGILGLLDEIASLMDDVASATKIATKNTVGILADDLAVNAEKASGFLSSRELPVLWKLTKGSLLNKLIILPAVFLLSAFLPVAIVPILLVGGTYLSFEGVLKIYEHFFHKSKPEAQAKPLQIPAEELEEVETKKVKSALLVDFILSVEIVIIALSTVMDESLQLQIIAVSVVAILATIGVYGIVALLVRMDDAGYRLMKNETEGFKFSLGKLLVKSLPIIVRILGIVGTLAMLLVGGGIFVHNIHYIHELVHGIPLIIADFLVGIIVGIVAFSLYKLGAIFFKKSQ